MLNNPLALGIYQEGNLFALVKMAINYKYTGAGSII